MLGDLLQEPEVTDYIQVCELVDWKIFDFVSDPVTLGLQLVPLDTLEAAAPDLALGTLVLGGVVTGPAVRPGVRTHDQFWKK